MLETIKITTLSKIYGMTLVDWVILGLMLLAVYGLGWSVSQMIRGNY